MSLHSLEEKASELEPKPALSPTAKGSEEAHMASEDEEEETGVQEEATSAHNSAQDTRPLDEKEKCGGNSAEFEDRSVDVQETLTVKEDDCNSKDHMDEVEGEGAMEDEPTAITRYAKQGEDLTNKMAALSLTHADPSLSSSGKSQSTFHEKSSFPFNGSREVNLEQSSPPDLSPSEPSSVASKREATLGVASPAHSHPPLSNLAPNPFSIEGCLYSFCQPELLEGEDKIYCQECTAKLQQSSGLSKKDSPTLEDGFSNDRCREVDGTSQPIVRDGQANPNCECGDCESSDTKFDCECEKHEPCHGERSGSCENVKHKYSEELGSPAVHSSAIEKDADSGLNDSDSKLNVCVCVCLCDGVQDCLLEWRISRK